MKIEPLTTPVEYLKAGLTLVHEGKLSRQFVKRVICEDCEYDGELDNGIITITRAPNFMSGMSAGSRHTQAQIKIDQLTKPIEEHKAKIQEIDDALAHLDTMRGSVAELKATKGKKADEVLDLQIHGIENDIAITEQNLQGHEQWKSDLQAKIDELQASVDECLAEQKAVKGIGTNQPKTYTFDLN